MSGTKARVRKKSNKFNIKLNLEKKKKAYKWRKCLFNFYRNKDGFVPRDLTLPRGSKNHAQNEPFFFSFSTKQNKTKKKKLNRKKIFLKKNAGLSK